MMTIDIPQSTPKISRERIMALQGRWDETLAKTLLQFYPEVLSPTNPGEELARHSQAEFTRDINKKLVVGIAGPGAAGKGTLGRYLITDEGFTKIINTTTRQPRSGEVDGTDYFFVENEHFSTKQKLGQFALHLLRPGRGWYGITREEIDQKLSMADNGCLLEENPENIITLLSQLDLTEAQKILLYILPPNPIVESALSNLNNRLSLEEDPTKRMLTPEVFESTLGDRQVDEFSALPRVLAYPDIQTLFVVNDDLEKTKQLLSNLVGAEAI